MSSSSMAGNKVKLTGKTEGGKTILYVYCHIEKMYDSLKTRMSLQEVTYEIQQSFLNISIGDNWEKVVEKLKVYGAVLNVGKASMSLSVCNSKVKGSFGRLIYNFEKDRDTDKLLLRKIIYEPFYNGE